MTDDFDLISDIAHRDRYAIIIDNLDDLEDGDIIVGHADGALMVSRYAQ